MAIVVRHRALYVALLFALILGALLPQVSHSSASEMAAAAQENCAKIEDVFERRSCYGREITALMPLGMAEVFDVVEELYAVEPTFRFGCHYNLHPVGDAAYRMYAETGRTDFMVADASVCSYGFYHGFMLALLTDTHDVRKARDFCDSLGGALIRERPDMIPECYHGVGHGIVDQYLWIEQGDTTDIAWVKDVLRAAYAPAVRDCDVLTEQSAQRSKCYSGVFHDISMLHVERGWAIDTVDPLWLCTEVPAAYKGNCAGNMHRVALALLKGASLPEVVAFMTSAYPNEPLILSNVVWYWGHNWSMDRDASSIIAMCKSVSSQSVQKSCLSGSVANLAFNGTPGSEYEAIATLCSSSLLSEEERLLCTEESFAHFEKMYSASHMSLICREYGTLYASQCDAEGRSSQSPSMRIMLR